jgi:hypothetical protein
MIDPPGSPLLRGYTMDDLDRFAYIAARRTRVSSVHVWDTQERVELALSAIGEALVVAVQRPSSDELIQAGRRAIYQGAADHRHEHGIGPRGLMPAAALYWLAVTTPDHAPRIDERTALRQIWPLLSGTDRQALAALAVLGTYQAAAAALNLNYDAFGMRVRQARARFFRHWWAPSGTPTRRWRDRRVAIAGQALPARDAVVRARERLRRRRPQRAVRPSGAS